MINIVHISVTDEHGGGAIAVNRIHLALLKQKNIKSRLFVLSSNSQKTHTFTFDYKVSFTERLSRSLRYRIYRRDMHDYKRQSLGVRDEFFTSDRSHLALEPIAQIPNCDIVHLHWISSFIDFSHLCTIVQKGLPVVWTLHDMNPFTGGCHYSRDCQHFKTRCGNCPLLDNRYDNDASRKIFDRKYSTMARVPEAAIKIIGPSQWIAEEARKSPVFSGKDVCVIPHPIDLEVFYPEAKIVDQELKALTLSAGGKIIILFIAHSANLYRKGYQYLLHALELVTCSKNALLLTVGGGHPESPKGMRHVHLTHIYDQERLNQVYNLADLCIVPSTQEAFGMTAQEALATGTPVIGFNTGGCADMIHSGWNGFLVPLGNIEELALAINELVSNYQLRKNMGKNARNGMMQFGSETIVAQSYTSAYKKLIESFPNTRSQ